jgi:hypothetical protein
MDNKYKNGKIYSIRNINDDTLIYVGSTIGPLYKRFSQHKSNSKNSKYENTHLYIKMNESDINDWYIELFEDFPCERKEQLTQREGQIIRQIATLNKNIPGRTKEEWREANKDKVIEYAKEYKKANKEQILINAKEYREANKDKAKEYREANKDIMRIYCKKYYLKNK